MVLYFILISLSRCSLDAVEEMFRAFEDSNTPISRDTELHRYFSSSNIRFHWNKDNKELKISCHTAYPVVSEELNKLKKLEKLDLSGNFLRSLPHNLNGLVNLLKVGLKYNLFIEIPPVIFKLRKLKHLDLSSNRITEIPGKITKFKSLHTLLLSNNFIENVAYEFKNCTSIKVLNLEGSKKLCRLNSNNPKISQEKILFSKFPKGLEYLDLSNTTLYFIPESLDFPNLLSLDLSNNFLRNLDNAFENLEHMKILNLDNNEISKFPSKLYRLQKLIKLSICGNLMTEVIFVEFSCMSLKSLKLDDNPLRKLIIHNGALRTLLTLSLDDTRLRSFVIKDGSVINSLHKQKTPKPLISMKIKRVMVCFESLDYIGAIFDLQNLTELFITCITKETQVPQHQLLRGFSNLQKLTILSMDNCGLKIIPRSLAKLQNLEILDLSNNLITKVPNFVKCISVKKILLERNLISKIPVETFHNPNVEYIGLRSNRIENLPGNLSKHHNFTGRVDISNNPIIKFGNEDASGLYDIPYTIVENIVIESKQLDVEPEELEMGINNLIIKSRYVWRGKGVFTLKTQSIKEHVLNWNGINSIFNQLKDKISDVDLQNSTLVYLKKVYKIGEVQKDISVMYGEPQRQKLKDYIEEILKLLLPFLNNQDSNMIENCFIVLENAHNICFDGQLEHLVEIYKSLTDKNLNCLETTISNILVKYKYEGLKLITTSNSYKENVHILSYWRNFFSESFGFENIPNLYSVDNTSGLLSSETYLMFQLFKHLSVDKIVEELKNEINENSNLMTETTGFLFDLFDEDLDKLEIMVTYDGVIEDFLITGVTTEGVEAMLSEYGLIERIN